MSRARVRSRQLAQRMGPAIPYLSVSAAATIAGALHRRRAAEITKPLPLLVLAAHSLRGTRRRNGVDNALLAGALALSAAGDRAMLLEEFTDEPSDKDRRLQIGASLFAGAQLCLTGIMWRRGARPRPAGVLLRTAILAESATVMALRRPRLLPVLGGYGNTLALMSSTAGASHRPQPRLRNGGWLFLASDLTIINRRHLIRDERLAAMAEAWVLASYFAAQWLLVTSLSEPDG